jgi:hypothetical protein
MTRSAHAVSRRHFLRTTGVAAAGGTLLARAPAALGQQARELNVWHTEVEPQTVRTIQDTSIAEFERKFPGFKVRQQALGWGDLNTKLLAALAAGGPPDLTHLNPFMTASLYVKNLLRPMDELIRALGDNDIHEATLKLQYFDGKVEPSITPSTSRAPGCRTRQITAVLQPGATHDRPACRMGWTIRRAGTNRRRRVQERAAHSGPGSIRPRGRFAGGRTHSWM